ncbi:NAD-dependent epimerase/dehydratase family protein [Stutzerimonas kunmingensis]|uniref:NAD-dependent epimerase/dehydratase family protein n=1 Tax=Stutzerimonas kunmingensis TaxID=1211807 RepID=UPI0028A8BF57|nr:NAD(P)-dependent oxidoreductase [Stutzerimonas kunmingensis]
MRLLLTGGTGFFGKSLLRHWQQATLLGQVAPQVTVLSRDPKKFLARHPDFSGLPWLKWHQGSILVPESLPANSTFTHVLHAAADSTIGPQLMPMQRYEQIVGGTRNLLDYAVRHRVQRFLLISSGGVYGPQPKNIDAIDERYNGMADPLEPSNAYCVAKRCAEHLCALYQQEYGIEALTARCFSFVGPDLPFDAHFAIGNFILDAIASEKITINGTGAPIRSYLDQRDLALWLDVLMRVGRPGRAYNIGSPEAISILDLADTVRLTLAPHKPVEVNALASADGPMLRYVPSISRIEREFGLLPRYGLQESIRFAARPLINKGRLGLKV